MSSVLITGGSGSVGKALLECLANNGSQGLKIKAQCSKDSSKDKIKQVNPHAEAVAFDLSDYNAALEAMNGLDMLVIITPYTVDMCVQGRMLIDAACESGVKYIIHLGVAQMNKSTKVNYTSWHLLLENYIESMVHKGKLQGFMHLRPNMFLENLLEYGGIKPLDKQNQVLSFALNPIAKMPWVSCKDIANVACQIILNPDKYKNQIFPITSEIASLNEIRDKIRSQTYLKHLTLQTPQVKDVYELLIAAHADPVYMRGFESTVEEANKAMDLSNVPGSKDGLTCFRQVCNKEPQTIDEWIHENIKQT